ncbi:nucleoporin subcomplex protein binding to Pom34-domain-containing protein [Infundibulicybe gibba]|nr:nucleoporin subcomplex protein binding to Pom34-domain-containing protein [Infundibulicybe gibba]
MMSGESSKRSNLVDITYLQLHATLSGHLEGVSIDQLLEYLNPRKAQLSNVQAPFGRPSDASREKVESGSVTLADGVILHIEDADKEFVFAISTKFQIDQLQSLVLPPFRRGRDFNTTMVAELLDAITPFYYSERLSVWRSSYPYFAPKKTSASAFLPQLIPDGEKFAGVLLQEYIRKTQEALPSSMRETPKLASQWAKQNAKEQLVLLEVLFWTMWGYAPCTGPLVEQIFGAAYSTNLGSLQRNETLLLDEEGVQLKQDCAALWILITIEVLELENLSEPGERIHDMVISHGDSPYTCIYLAWAFVLSRLASTISEATELTLPQSGRTYSKDREPVHVLMSRTCLDPGAGLFGLILSLLTGSPLFVTAVAWRTGSTVTDPNAIAFRSVLKGLLTALIELVPVELIPDFDTFVEIWIALFGRSESQSVAGICAQFWQADWQHGIARRAVFDVARSRFPIQVKPLLRLLRAMTASGYLDSDQLSTTDHSYEGQGLTEERDICDRHVFYYLDKLPTFSQVIPVNACTGAHALYERQPERYGSSSSSPGLTYINLRPIKLPGGTTLPARSVGTLLSGDGGDFIVVCWQHEHSGWKVILEILTDFVNRKRMHVGSSNAYQDVSFAPRGANQVKTLGIEDIGMEMAEGDDTLVTDALDLIRSLVQDNPLQAEQLVQSLEAGDPVVAHTMTEAQPPDMVQLTTTILEEALSRSEMQTRSQPRTKLITSAISVLAALLALPSYSNRVWLYIRSTTALFGSDKKTGFTSVALAAERATGHYTMTLALIHLVQQLFREACSSILPDNPKLLQLKEEVLLRAARFVHTEIWVEHLGWKYAQLGDRFEIGRRVASFYVEVLEHAPPMIDAKPFLKLSQSIADALLFKASMSTINPVITSVNSGAQLLHVLYTSRRFGDARGLIFLLEAHLSLMRLILNYKQCSNAIAKPSLLEQALCSRAIHGSTTQDRQRPKVDSIDILASFVRERDVGTVVPLEAMRVLSSLCTSLSSSQPSYSTITGHLANPEVTVAALIRIVQHPYDEPSLRNAVWNFISLAVDKEPALANLFVSGRFRTPFDGANRGLITASDKPGEQQTETPEKSKSASAIDVARDMLTNWKEMWNLNPQLLASVFRFLHIVWQHGLEHKSAIASLRTDKEFWSQIILVTSEEVGPCPEYDTDTFVTLDGVQHSSLHELIATHSYRTMVKSYAVHIIGQDLGIHRQSHNQNQLLQKPQSFAEMEALFKSPEQLADLISDATPNSYDPRLHDQLAQEMQSHFPGLSLEQLRSQEPIEEREFGDNFSFSVSRLRTRLQAYRTKEEVAEVADLVERKLHSINMNMSLAHTQAALTDSWQFLLRQAIPYLRNDQAIRSSILSIAASLSFDIALEQRSGDMMATMHGTRLSLLLALLEVAWFSTSDKASEIKSFVELVRNVHNIIVSEAQPPAKSFLGTLTVPFHRTLLQIVYFCSRHCRSLLQRPKALVAEQRLTITPMIEATLSMVIDALQIIFESARGRLDIELDRDMELLVAVFEQCARKDLYSASTIWLTRCQETNIIRASLDLYTHIDLVGLSDLPLLLSRKQPLYAPHLLLFHMVLASSPLAAERFASEGALPAYSNNSISAAISSGRIDVALPELPGERSPAHRAYCFMLSIVANVIATLGRHNHYFDSEASGFIQLYGDQISRTLSWTIGESITLPLLEEMEQVVNLFYAISNSAPTSAQSSPAVDKVLRVFATHSLQLLQQLNYAITHPNHLASLLEPITSEERSQVEKEAASPELLARPLIAHMMHRLFRLSSNIINTLITISRAEAVLLDTQEEWPVSEALIVPHSKVVLGEPASMGTLLELANCTLDILRDLVSRPAGQSITRAVALIKPLDDPLDVRQGVITARRNLESILVYSITQLAMWLSKPEFDVPPSDTEMEEQSMDAPKSDVPSAKDRRTARSSSLAERLRRGMTGEMAADLQSLLTKSKPIILSSNTITGKESIDLTPILLHFLHEHIITPS